MDVPLTPELEQFVRERGASGKYESAKDVILDGLHLLHAQKQDEEEKLAWPRTAIDEGIASADRGEFLSGEQVLARLRTRIGRQNVS